MLSLDLLIRASVLLHPYDIQRVIASPACEKGAKTVRIAGCSKRLSNKAARSLATEAYCRTSQGVGRRRTKLGAFFSSLLKVPCDAPHHHPRIARHKVNVGHTCCLASESRLKSKHGLFPVRIEEILHEEKCLQASMRKLHGNLIALGEVEIQPGRRSNAAIFD